MADNTIIQQGIFTSNGSAETLVLEGGCQWIKVRNLTNITSGGLSSVGCEFYWQVGMANDDAVVTLYNAAGTAVTMSTAATLAVDGFTPFDSEVISIGAQVAVTGVDNGTPPTVFTGNTAGLKAGDIVRIINVVGAQQLGAMDFEISNIVANTSFDLAFMQPIVDANPGAGFYRLISNAGLLYTPRNRFITNMSQAAQMIVTMSVHHHYEVGEAIRLTVPAAFGMVEANTLEGNIVAIGAADADGYTNTITLDIDSSGFSAFAFPLTAATPFSPAMVVPIGEDTSLALANNQNILADATVNTGFTGIILGAGHQSPAGEEDDVIMWVAGQSFLDSPFGN